MGWPAPPPPARHGRRERSLPIAVLIAVLVIGVGGFAVTQGVRYVVGYITGNESGTERLIQPVRASASGLTLTVESVEHTAHFTRVELVARNQTGISLRLNLFETCVLSGDDGTTLKADSFKSDWSEEVPAEGVQRGTITFSGHLPDRVRRATLSFSTIFAQGFSGPRSIRVSGLALRPP